MIKNKVIFFVVIILFMIISCDNKDDGKNKNYEKNLEIIIDSDEDLKDMANMIIEALIEK